MWAQSWNVYKIHIHPESSRECLFSAPLSLFHLTLSLRVCVRARVCACVWAYVLCLGACPRTRLRMWVGSTDVTNYLHRKFLLLTQKTSGSSYFTVFDQEINCSSLTALLTDLHVTFCTVHSLTWQGSIAQLTAGASGGHMGSGSLQNTALHKPVTQSQLSNVKLIYLKRRERNLGKKR